VCFGPTERGPIYNIHLNFCELKVVAWQNKKQVVVFATIKRNGSTRSLVLSQCKLHDLAFSPLFVCLHCLGFIISCAVRNRNIKISLSSLRILVGGRGMVVGGLWEGGNVLKVCNNLMIVIVQFNYNTYTINSYVT